MEQEQSLEGIISQAQILMKTTKKKLAEMPEDTLLDFFHAAETHTIQKTYELASILGFYKIKSVKLVCFKKKIGLAFVIVLVKSRLISSQFLDSIIMEW